MTRVQAAGPTPSATTWRLRAGDSHGWIFPVAGVLLWVCLLPGIAWAETGYADQVVRCQSRDMEWVHCDMPVGNGVELVRQLSDNSCVRGSEWGTDRTGVWVTLGCRAEFRSRGSAASAGGTERKVRRVVRCESNGRPTSCPVILQGAPVRLLRQLGAMPCREDHSWGEAQRDMGHPWLPGGLRGRRGRRQWVPERAAYPGVRIQIPPAPLLWRRHQQRSAADQAAVRQRVRAGSQLGLGRTRGMGGRGLSGGVPGQLTWRAFEGRSHAGRGPTIGA